MRKKIDHVNQSGLSAGAAGVDDEDVLEALHSLMHLARERQHRAMRDAGSPISPLEGRVLAFFAHHPGATLSELVTHSGRDKGQLARLVSGLRERGLLAATPDTQDRRVSRLHLAGEAQAQHEAMRAQRRALSAQAAAGLSADERRQLMALLDKVRTALQRD